MRVHSRVMCACVSIHLHVCALCTGCVTCVHVSVVCTQAAYICIYVRARCSCAGLMWNVCACDACTGMCICAHACVCMRHVCIARVASVCMNACVCACACVASVCTNAHVCACAHVCSASCVQCVACPSVQWTMARSLMVTWSQAGSSLCPSDARGHPALSLEPPRPPISSFGWQSSHLTFPVHPRGHATPCPTHFHPCPSPCWRSQLCTAPRVGSS